MPLARFLGVSRFLEDDSALLKALQCLLALFQVFLQRRRHISAAFLGQFQGLGQQIGQMLVHLHRGRFRSLHRGLSLAQLGAGSLQTFDAIDLFQDRVRAFADAGGRLFHLTGSSAMLRGQFFVPRGRRFFTQGQPGFGDLRGQTWLARPFLLRFFQQIQFFIQRLFFVRFFQQRLRLFHDALRKPHAPQQIIPQIIQGNVSQHIQALAKTRLSQGGLMLLQRRLTFPQCSLGLANIGAQPIQLAHHAVDDELHLAKIAISHCPHLFDPGFGLFQFSLRGGNAQGVFISLRLNQQTTHFQQPFRFLHRGQHLWMCGEHLQHLGKSIPGDAKSLGRLLKIIRFQQAPAIGKSGLAMLSIPLQPQGFPVRVVGRLVS